MRCWFCNRDIEWDDVHKSFDEYIEGCGHVVTLICKHCGSVEDDE